MQTYICRNHYFDGLFSSVLKIEQDMKVFGLFPLFDVFVSKRT